VLSESIDRPGGGGDASPMNTNNLIAIVADAHSRRLRDESRVTR
jgi:hypothetical protein